MRPTAEQLVNEYDDEAVNGEQTLLGHAVLAREIDEVIANLQVVRKTVNNRLNDMMDGKAKTEITGFGVLERTRWTRWSPVNDAAEVVLVGRIANELRGKTRSPATAAANAALALRQCASFTWRTGQLKVLGISPGLYLEQKHGDWVVKIPGST